MKTLPSQEYLKSRIDYNPETGEARWKEVDESFGYNWQRFNANSSNKLLPKRASIQGQVYSTERLIYKLVNGTDPGRFSFGQTIPMMTVDEKIRVIKSTHSNKVYNPIPETLIDKLSFDHRTGNLIWKSRGIKDWDNRFSGQSAGSVGKSGYVSLKIKIDGVYQYFQAHRVAWFLYYGVSPTIYQIDHLNSNRLDNSIKNLRLANDSLNQQAKGTKKKFFKRPNSNTFYSSINISGKNIYLGDFDTPEEARDAYQGALIKYKPIYTFTTEEQKVLDELYQNYPNVTKDLQHRAHAIQVKALEFYINAGE